MIGEAFRREPDPWDENVRAWLNILRNEFILVATLVGVPVLRKYHRLTLPRNPETPVMKTFFPAKNSGIVLIFEAIFLQLVISGMKMGAVEEECERKNRFRRFGGRFAGVFSASVVIKRNSGGVPNRALFSPIVERDRECRDPLQSLILCRGIL